MRDAEGVRTALSQASGGILQRSPISNRSQFAGLNLGIAEIVIGNLEPAYEQIDLWSDLQKLTEQTHRRKSTIPTIRTISTSTPYS